MTHGTRLLHFNCTACGQCCRAFRVPVTDADVRRLATSLPDGALAEVLEWLSPEEVDMVGEPETFVRLPVGRRLLVLRHRDGACVLLRDDSCSVYPSRPRSCQLYPWDITLGRRGGVTRLRLVVEYEPCKANYDGNVSPRVLAEQRRWERSEIAAYVRLVAAWNRLQMRRERLGKSLLGAEAYLAKLMLREQALTAVETTRTSTA